MFKSVLSSVLLAGLAAAAPGYSNHGGHYHHQSQCHTTYDIKYDTACQTYHEQKCHEEYDVVVDTTYVEECQDIVTQHCEQVHQQVHHSSAVVGHDSAVVAHGHSGYHKREAEAEAEPGYGYPQHNNKQCFSKPHKQCHQKPVHNERQECHEEYDVIVDTTYIEECEDIITTHCEQTSQQVHHSSAVVGHDSQVVSHGVVGYGHGYGKREAEAEPGYASEPKCHDKKDRQCHKKPVQNSRKVPRPVCKTVVDTTYIEECEETFTTHCHSATTQVHHSSAVVGHDTQVVGHTVGHAVAHAGYGKREAKAEAEPGYGYSSGPQCHAKKDRQCHKKPVQSSHKVPRQVCVPVPRQECHPIEVKVPRQVCDNFGYAVEDQSYGHHGYGYGH